MTRAQELRRSAGRRALADLTAPTREHGRRWYGAAGTGRTLPVPYRLRLHAKNEPSTTILRSPGRPGRQATSLTSLRGIGGRARRWGGAKDGALPAFRRRRWSKALLPALVLASCTTTLPGRGLVSPGDYVAYLDSREADLSRRTYLIHVPPRRGEAGPAPVVLVLHGAFSTARGIEERSGFSRLADEQGFVAVYPNGYGFLGILRHWNAGHCCGRARSLALDDVGFLDGVLDDVARRIEIDPTRVYVVGESNGAMLAYQYAAVRSRRIAGAAAVIGTIGSGPAGAEERVPPPELPVPMVIVHGSADTRIPFQGGASERDPEVSWISVADGAAFWVAHNGARPEAETTMLYGGRVVRSEWHGDGDAAPVFLYEIRDWPHVWPGPDAMATLAPEDPLREFDTARIVWEDLRSQRRK